MRGLVDWQFDILITAGLALVKREVEAGAHDDYRDQGSLSPMSTEVFRKRELST